MRRPVGRRSSTLVQSAPGRPPPASAATQCKARAGIHQRGQRGQTVHWGALSARGAVVCSGPAAVWLARCISRGTKVAGPDQTAALRTRLRLCRVHRAGSTVLLQPTIQQLKQLIRQMHLNQKLLLFSTFPSGNPGAERLSTFRCAYLKSPRTAGAPRRREGQQRGPS